MKKDNRNRRKAAIGAVIAAGMTTGAIAACAGNEAKPAQSEKPDVELSSADAELTAADKVVIDGQEIDSTELLPQDTIRNVVRPMYGVRQRPIHLMYGPRRPRPGVVNPDDSSNPIVLERQVMEVVAAALNIAPRNVQVASKLDEDFKITQEQREQLKTALEDRFGIVIYDETFNMMKTVGDLVNCVSVLKND
ncbi:MAG: acyl carrier protein [Muribaculaceae bacterium]|nr:acyl carrier protein [Muribaculaceae bacterium]